MQVVRKMNVPPGQWNNLNIQPIINRIPSKQNNILKTLTGRELKAAQSNKIMPKHAQTNSVSPPPGQCKIRKIAPKKNSAASAHKRRLIAFVIMKKFKVIQVLFPFYH